MNLMKDCLLKAGKHGNFEYISVGFASLAMNMIGTTSEIDDVRIYSYAPTQSQSLRDGVNELISLDSTIAKSHYNKTGTVLHHPSYAIAQLRATKMSRKLHSVKWQTLAGMVIRELIKIPCCPMSLSEASWTGMFDYRTLTWDDCSIELGGTNLTELPELIDFDQMSMTIPMDHQIFPELAGCKIYLSIGDGAAASVAAMFTSNALQLPAHVSSISPSQDNNNCNTTNNLKRFDSMISVTIGTSAAVRMIVTSEIASTLALHNTGLFCYRINKDYCVIGGALTDGGSVINWLQRVVCGSGGSLGARDTHFDAAQSKCNALILSEEELMARLQQQVSSLPLMLPFFSGERATGWHAGATASLHGLTLDTQLEDILFAACEGIVIRLACITRELINLVKQSCDDAQREYCLCVSGAVLEGVNTGLGGDTSHAWRQLLADVTNISVIASQFPNNSGVDISPSSSSLSSLVSSSSLLPTSALEMTSLGVALLMNGYLSSSSSPSLTASFEPEQDHSNDISEAHPQGALHRMSICHPRPRIVQHYSNSRHQDHCNLYDNNFTTQ